MDFNDVLAILSDLPNTFSRPGNTYESILTAFTAGAARNTIAIDALISQLTLPTSGTGARSDGQAANWGWLDAIGRMYGILRYPYENDPAFRTRILGTLVAPHVTPTAMINFIQLALGISITIEEDFTTCSYRISLNQSVSNQVLDNIVDALVWVRPAGVPFLPIFTLSRGLFLNTLNYFGTKKVTGSYLISGTAAPANIISDTTPAPQGLLPTVYLTDPFLTGVVSPKKPFVPISSTVTDLVTLT